MRPLLIASLFALLATPALAAGDGAMPQTGASPPPAAAATTPPPKTNSGPNPNDVICKYAETTGSRIPSAKVCRTRADWDAISAHNRDTMDDMQERGDTLVKTRGG
jgi:hypothetical protein